MMQGYQFVLVWLAVISEAAFYYGWAETSEENLANIRSIVMCPSGYYGRNCRHHCHCREVTECYNVPVACNSGCADGWVGPTCQSKNLAFKMPTEIRTRNRSEVLAKESVDGNLTTCINSTSNMPGWLRVDLSSTFSVYHVTIFTNSVSARGWKLFVTEYSDFYWAVSCATVRTVKSHIEMTCDSPTNGRYLSLFNPQGPVSVCELQAYVCAKFTFGDKCEHSCNCEDSSEVCHPLRGQCISGCLLGYTGHSCLQGCTNSYGSNCAHPCGNCAANQTCNPIDGACPGTCQPGWTGVNCNVTCPAGSYGDRCNLTCGHCQEYQTCNPETGHCMGLCRPGWHGDRCQEECGDGTYGPSCQFTCGHCLHGTKCDATSGFCLQGCESGWEGLFCTQECLPYYFGHNCMHKCHHCLTSCDSKTGICDSNGCTSGWKGDRCKQECTKGFYGENCSSTCGYCFESVCDVVTGYCPDAYCQPGWNGSHCTHPCTPGTYGINCSDSCGACKANICDHITGTCPGECAFGFFGEMCKESKVLTSTSSKTVASFVVALMVIVGVVMFGVCICLTLKWRRDRILVHHLMKCFQKETSTVV